MSCILAIQRFQRHRASQPHRHFIADVSGNVSADRLAPPAARRPPCKDVSARCRYRSNSRANAAASSASASTSIDAPVAFAIRQIYSRAPTLARYLGSDGTKVALWVSAFLLLCAGVRIMLTGPAAFVQTPGGPAG